MHTHGSLPHVGGSLPHGWQHMHPRGSLSFVMHDSCRLLRPPAGGAGRGGARVWCGHGGAGALRGVGAGLGAGAVSRLWFERCSWGWTALAWCLATCYVPGWHVLRCRQGYSHDCYSSCMCACIPLSLSPCLPALPLRRAWWPTALASWASAQRRCPSSAPPPPPHWPPASRRRSRNLCAPWR